MHPMPDGAGEEDGRGGRSQPVGPQLTFADQWSENGVANSAWTEPVAGGMGLATLFGTAVMASWVGAS